MNYCEAQKKARVLNRKSPLKGTHEYTVEMCNYEPVEYEVWRKPKPVELPVVVVDVHGEDVGNGY